MLQPDVVARLRLLTDTARVPESVDTTRVNQVTALTPGQRVTARVERALPDQRFHVEVQGKTYEVKLPTALRPGTTLDLTYITDTPRPTFVLPGTQRAQGSDAFSSIGRILADLLAPGRNTAGATRQLPSPPVLPHPPANTSDMPALLRTALVESGIFYESHQAQWIAGRLPLEQLRREPQGRLTPLPHSAAPAEDGSSVQDFAGTHRSNAGDGRDATTGTDTRTRAPAVETNANTPSRASGSSGNPVHPEATPLVRQQLEALDTRHVLWKGEAWPGQWMEWETGQDASQASPRQQEAWYSTITLELPALGVVRIRASLANLGARIHVECLDSETGEDVARARAVLANNLATNGVHLTEFSVDTDEQIKDDARTDSEGQASVGRNEHG